MVNPAEPFQFPKNSSPVDAIAQRLQGWQNLATSLAEYAGQLAELNRSNSATNGRLSQILHSCSVKPNNEAVLTLLPGALVKLHTELYSTNRHSANTLSSAANQFKRIAIDAQQRAENIRTYNQHFGMSHQVKEAQSRAQSEIKNFQSALEYKDSSSDPYVLKPRVEKALAAQISLENRLLENYYTVQTLGAKYDAKIVESLNKTVRYIEDAFAVSGAIQVEFCNSVKANIFAPRADDFDQFIAKNGDSFITENVEAREICNARYDGQYSTASRDVRKGTLERRTKYLHSFVPGEYLLTLGSLYEIKDGHRALGIDLSDAELLEDHKHSTDDRFVLRARQQGSSSGKHHTWVFKSDDARKWKSDLKKILSAPVGQRAVAVFGSDNYDPEAEASTLSEKNNKAQVPNSLQAHAPPADSASTAAVASGQNTPNDGANPPGQSSNAAPIVGAAGAGGLAGAAAGRYSRPKDQNQDAGAEGATDGKSQQQQLKEDYDPHGKGPDANVPVQNAEYSNSNAQTAGAAGAGGLAGAAAGQHSRSNEQSQDAGAEGATDGKSQQQQLKEEYDPHGKGPDANVPVQDAEYSNSNAQTAGAAGAGGLAGAAAGQHSRSNEQSQDAGAEGNSQVNYGSIEENPYITPGTTVYASSSGNPNATAGSSEGTADKPHDPYGNSNGAQDVNSPTEHNKTQLGYRDTSSQDVAANKNLSSEGHPDIAQPRTGGAHKSVAAGAGAGALGGAAAAHGVQDSSNSRDSTTSSHYSKSAGVNGANSGAYDSDSASSVSEVDYSRYEHNEVVASTASVPAHSAAWQAQQDLAAFDKKAEERDSVTHDSSAIATGDADSQFSYDKKHRASTYTGEDYKPDDVLPPHVERKLTQTYHKYEDSPLEGIGAARTQEEVSDPSDKHFERRCSSVSLKDRKPSRSATASYGSEELKPLTNPDKSEQGKAELFFADELPTSTSGNP